MSFRSPLHDGRSFIVSLQNPTGIFEADEVPQIAHVLEELELGGQGIRGLSYVRSIGAHLVTGKPVPREQAHSSAGSGAVGKAHRHAVS